MIKYEIAINVKIECDGKDCSAHDTELAITKESSFDKHNPDISLLNLGDWITAVKITKCQEIIAERLIQVGGWRTIGKKFLCPRCQALWSKI